MRAALLRLPRLRSLSLRMLVLLLASHVAPSHVHPRGLRAPCVDDVAARRFALRRARSPLAVAAPVDSVASRAASAIRDGSAHVERAFLSGDALQAARTDMTNVLAQITAQTELTEFQSIETSLMDPGFRQQLLAEQPLRGPCPLPVLLF